MAYIFREMVRSRSRNKRERKEKEKRKILFLETTGLGTEFPVKMNGLAREEEDI